MHTALLLSHSFLLNLRRNDLSVYGIVSYCSKAVNISIRSLETMVSKWDSYRMTLYIVAVSTGGKGKKQNIMTQMFLSQFTWLETSVFGSITFQDNAWLFGILATECWSESNLWVMRQLSPTIRPPCCRQSLFLLCSLTCCRNLSASLRPFPIFPLYLSLLQLLQVSLISLLLSVCLADCKIEKGSNSGFLLT